MNPRFHPDYRTGDLLRCLLPSSSSSMELFKEEFRRSTGHPIALPFRYGRSGLYFLLKALGLKEKKVVLPSYTCVVVAHAIQLSGNYPVFLDNQPNSFQPAPMDYLDAIDEDVAMVIPTHLFGISEEFSDVYHQIKSRHPSVFVLQDCAHSFFCEDSTGRVVTEYGDGAIFGLNISKLVNSVKGGMLTLRDSNLAREIEKAHQLETTPAKSSLKSRAYALAVALAFTEPGFSFVNFLKNHSKLLDSETKYFSPNLIELPDDFAGTMLDFEAEIGLRSIRRLPERIARRRELATLFIETLSPYTGLIEKMPSNSSGNTWSHFPFTVKSEIRNNLRDHLEKRTKAEVGEIVDYSVADLPCYQELGHRSTPNALNDAKCVLNLPLTFREGFTFRSAEDFQIKLSKSLEEFASNYQADGRYPSKRLIEIET